MFSKELKIDHYVLDKNNKVQQITPAMILEQYQCDLVGTERYKPIIITKDIVVNNLKFHDRGFESYQLNHTLLSILGEGVAVFIDTTHLGLVLHIHTLQDYIKLMTGDDLIYHDVI